MTNLNETPININNGIYSGELITNEVIHQILEQYEYYDSELEFEAFQKIKENIKPQTDMEELNLIARYYSEEHEININKGVYAGVLITVEVIAKIIGQYDYEDIQMEKHAFDEVNNAIMPETDMEELNKIAKSYSKE